MARAARDVMTAMIYGGVPLNEAALAMLDEESKKPTNATPAGMEDTLERNPDGSIKKISRSKIEKWGLFSPITKAYHGLFQNLGEKAHKFAYKMNTGPAALIATGALLGLGAGAYHVYKNSTNPQMQDYEQVPMHQQQMMAQQMPQYPQYPYGSY